MKSVCRAIVVSGLAVALGGCLNLASNPSEIAPAYVPSAQYASYSCQQLSVELTNLARRKAGLVTAQEQRRQSSKVQAFWVGYGNGDGVAAGQLSTVKGEILAVQKEQDTKGCPTHS